MPNNNRVADGDNGFLGIDTRSNPSTLKQGVLQDGNNIRIELASLQVRKGIKRLLEPSFCNNIGKIYGTGIYTKPDGTEFIVIVCETELYLYNTTTGTVSSSYAFPYNTINSVRYYRKVTEEQTQVIQAVNKVYILRGEATKYIDGNGSVGQRVSATNGSNIVTVTCNLPHGLSVGSEFIIETPHIELNGPTVNSGFVVDSVISPTSFTYKIPTPYNQNNHGAYVIQVGKPVLVFNGTEVTIVNQGIIDGTVFGGTSPTACDFPPTSRAIYHKNRLYCKYSKDEICVSDYLPNSSGDWKFDLTIQALTINQGDEQDIVGFYPWTRDEILVFKTNSIYAAKFADNTSSPSVILSESYVRTLTFDLGCVSARSVANVGGVVFFLSSKGIYALEPQLDTNLLSNTLPLSINIQKYINRINQKFVHRAVGIVYNGRYYLGVPVDNSEYINHVFVYNINNKMWESVDTYPIDFSTFSESEFNSPYIIWDDDTSKTSIYITKDWDYNDSGELPADGIIQTGDYISISDITSGYFPYTTGISVKHQVQLGRTRSNYHAIDFPIHPESGVFKISSMTPSGSLAPDYEVIIDGRVRTELDETPTSDTGILDIGVLKWSTVRSMNLQNLLVTVSGNERRLFTVDARNGLFLMEELNDDEFGETASSISFANFTSVGIPFSSFQLTPTSYESRPIAGYAKTRRYDFNTLEDKRFSSLNTDLDFEQGGGIQTLVNTLNPDTSKLVDQTSASSQEDYTRSFPIRKVAVGADVEFRSLQGRPIIKSLTIDAILVGRDTKNKQ
jgi:hypothetical protein